MAHGQYIIRGGAAGRERLRLLARIMKPTTQSLFERVGIRPGMSCLDCGCGGGDVTFDLAVVVGNRGRVVGLDIDEIKLNLARGEASALQLDHVEFRLSNITESDVGSEFDVVYSRFLLTHLADPQHALRKMLEALRPGGLLVVEDIDFDGHFSHPECNAFRRYVELYSAAARRRGADPTIGPRLPSLLADAGIEGVEMHVVQPAGLRGDVKLLTPVTMESIADSILAEGLTDRHEIDRIVAELYEFAHDPGTLMSLPRVVQAWGRRLM
jgi:ubiquinone/menaquinone biosynthesis C-methylase UbiE